jgi:hypothetical protein
MSFGFYTFPQYSCFNFGRCGFGAGYEIGGFGSYGSHLYNFLGPTATGWLAQSMVTPTNYVGTLYANLDSPSGVSSVAPLVDYAVNRPYYGGFTGFSLWGAMTGGLIV